MEDLGAMCEVLKFGSVDNQESLKVSSTEMQSLPACTKLVLHAYLMNK